MLPEGRLEQPSSEADATLSQTAEPQPDPVAGDAEVTVRGSDRRVSTRLRFPHKQYVAPYHGGCLPSRVSFKEVACQDISSTCFSFLSSQPPDFESLVVALGVAPNVTYMTARVINRVRIADHPAPLYRIGCRFSGRLT
jgi:hypothetical protein